MLVDMLNYGAAAQEYFGYHVDDLANSELTATQKGYATQSVTPVNKQEPSENYAGCNLVLNNGIVLTMFYRNVTTDMYAMVSYTDHYGNEQSFRVNGSEFVKSGTFYGVEIDTLAVADGGQVVTCTIYNADGTVYATAKDSVEGYIARMSETDALYAMTMKFIKASYNMFH